MLTQNGLVLAGLSPDERLVEIVEVPDHPWFVTVQFHPELKSRLINPHPLFRDFVKAAVVYNEKTKDGVDTRGISEDNLSRVNR